MSGHPKTVKRFHEPGDCHELTFSCDRRIPLLTNDERNEDTGRVRNSVRDSSSPNLLLRYLGGVGQAVP